MCGLRLSSDLWWYLLFDRVVIAMTYSHLHFQFYLLLSIVKWLIRMMLCSLLQYTRWRIISFYDENGDLYQYGIIFRENILLLHNLNNCQLCFIVEFWENISTYICSLKNCRTYNDIFMYSVVWQNWWGGLSHFKKNCTWGVVRVTGYTSLVCQKHT